VLQKTVDSLVAPRQHPISCVLFHFMRTTPLEKWRDQAVHDRMIRRAIENILDFPISDFTFAQAASLPNSEGWACACCGAC
jgi:hypothetical protein